MVRACAGQALGPLQAPSTQTRMQDLGKLLISACIMAQHGMGACRGSSRASRHALQRGRLFGHRPPWSISSGCYLSRQEVRLVALGFSNDLQGIKVLLVGLAAAQRAEQRGWLSLVVALSLHPCRRTQRETGFRSLLVMITQARARGNKQG